MLKLLLTILLFSIGVKITTANGTFLQKYVSMQVDMESQDEENEKGSQKESKQFEEDKLYTYFPFEHIVSPSGDKSPLFARSNNIYSSYLGKPSTPPPDHA